MRWSNAMLKQRRVVITNRYFPYNLPNVWLWLFNHAASTGTNPLNYQQSSSLFQILFSSNMASIDVLSNPLKFSALVLILSIFIVQLFLRKLNKKQKKYKYHPVAGTVFTQLLHFNRVHHYMTNLAGKYKTYRLRAPFRSEIYTVDPVNVEYILKTNFENYGKVIYFFLLWSISSISEPNVWSLFLWRGLCKIILMNSRTNYECSQKKFVRVMRIWVGIFYCSLFHQD